MWKPLLACTTMLSIAGPALAYAQQPSHVERPHHARVTADDIAAFTEARLAALQAALKLTPDQEKHWPAVEQALRDISKEGTARREARRTAERRTDAIERMRDRADVLTARAAVLRRLADAAQPLYQSLDAAQKRRFELLARIAARQHRLAARWHGGGGPGHVR